MMDPRRLRLLRELARQGTMQAVGEVTGYTTSGVSHQLAVLEREAGVKLIEPDGRGVRLTPAGRRLVEHAEVILGALAAAEADLVTTDEPTGQVRITGFTSSITFLLVPLIEELYRKRTRVEVSIFEGEPREAVAQLRDDEVEMALVYDYTLNPRFKEQTNSLLIGVEPVHVALPIELADKHGLNRPTITAADLTPFASENWITSSRSSDDDELLSRLGGIAGFAPRIRHRVDSTQVIARMVADGFGLSLMPRIARPQRTTGVCYPEIIEPALQRRIFALTRPGTINWPPLELVRSRLQVRCRALGLA
ncbi:MAG: LysR family transcriptional regulator [Actinomycetes bacterium]